jgi:hypothetical protein
MNARKTRATPRSKISLRITRRSTVSLSVGNILALQSPNHHDAGPIPNWESQKSYLPALVIVPTLSSVSNKHAAQRRISKQDFPAILYNVLLNVYFMLLRSLPTMKTETERLAVKISHHATRSANDFSHACADQTRTVHNYICRGHEKVQFTVVRLNQHPFHLEH